MKATKGAKAVKSAKAAPRKRSLGRAKTARATGAAGEKFVLRLYVTGMTLRSRRAIANIKRICEEHLAGRYDLEIIDIYQHPTLARDEQIVAAPTLIKKLPAPLRRFIGDLSSTDRILLGLDLKVAKQK